MKESIIIIHPAGDYYAEMTKEQFDRGLLTIRDIPEEELIDRLQVQAVYDLGLTDVDLTRRVFEATHGFDPDEDWDESCLPGELTPIGLVRWSIARSGIEDANSGEEQNYAYYENIAFKHVSTDDEDFVLDDTDDSGEE